MAEDGAVVVAAAGREPSAAHSAVERMDCLSSAELESVVTAPPGDIPQKLAEHLASCERCQTRLLSHGKQLRERRETPPVWRIGAVLLAMLIALATFVYLAFWLSGG